MPQRASSRFWMFLLVLISVSVLTSTVSVVADESKLNFLFDDLERVELKLKGTVVLTADHTSNKAISEVEHHIFRDGKVWCVHTIRNYKGNRYEELTLRRNDEVIRFNLPFEGSSDDDIGATLRSPHINGDEISHFSPTQRCELVNLGIFVGRSIRDELLGAASRYGDTTVRYLASDNRVVENIAVRITGDQKYYGRVVSEINMGGTSIYPKGEVKQIDLIVDQITYEDFRGRPFMKNWTVSNRILSAAGPVVTQTSEFSVTYVGAGKSLERESELFGVSFAAGTPVNLNGSALKYVWDGVWAVPMTHPLSPTRFASQNRSGWTYIVSGAVLLLCVVGVVWFVQGRRQ